MPVQFHCKNCQGRIEVDSEHAGGKAICPFCGAVNDVPRESEPPGPVAAAQGPSAGRPTEATHPNAPEVPLSKSTKDSSQITSPIDRHDPFDTEQAGLPPPAARTRLGRMGALGLAGALLSIVLMLGPIMLTISYLPDATRQQFSRYQEMTPAERQDFQKQATEDLTQIFEQHGWLKTIATLGMLLWVVSLMLNISVVFSRGTHRRTSAWAGLAVNGTLLFVCLCSGMMQRLAGS